MSHESSLLLVKPDGVRRRVGSLALRLARDQGLDAESLGLLTLAQSDIDRVYPELADEPQYAAMIAYLTSGPLELIVLRGNLAVSQADSIKRQIRHMFGMPDDRNLIHAPDGQIDAAYELAAFVPLTAGLGRVVSPALPWDPPRESC